MNTTNDPLRDANAILGPYDAEDALLASYTAVQAAGSKLLGSVIRLRQGQESACRLRNALTTLLAELPGLYLAAERIDCMTGGHFNPEATPFYSLRTAALEELTRRAADYRVRHIAPRPAAAVEDTPLYTKKELLDLVCAMAEQGKGEPHD